MDEEVVIQTHSADEAKDGSTDEPFVVEDTVLDFLGFEKGVGGNIMRSHVGINLGHDNGRRYRGRHLCCSLSMRQLEKYRETGMDRTQRGKQNTREEGNQGVIITNSYSKAGLGLGCPIMSDQIGCLRGGRATANPRETSDAGNCTETAVTMSVAREIWTHAGWRINLVMATRAYWRPPISV